MFSPASFNHFRPSRSTPPTADDAKDVPLYVFEAAQSVNATHLSADGKIAYDERGSVVWRCFWDEEAKAFDGWWRTDDGLPSDAVRM